MMDPDVTWGLITAAHTEPTARPRAALELLVWLAIGGFAPEAWRGPTTRWICINTCDEIITAEFDALDRMMGE